MSTLGVCLLIAGLVLLDLLAVHFGNDSRQDDGRLPDRWFGVH
jgi:hypothetical protein